MVKDLALTTANFHNVGGMSGGPVMRLANTRDVIGINVGSFSDTGNSAFLPVTTALQNMLHTVNITHI